MATAIQLTHLTKQYGTARGVSNLSLEIPQGSIFGFLGPNGAGKTTTISMLVDLIRPTSGKVTVFGRDANKDGVKIRQRMGFLAGDFALDEALTGQQQLEYFANLRGNFEPKRIKALAARLDCNLHRPIRTLSRGNRQKVGLISALMHDPDLLIFDEPTTGLDPLIQAEFNSIILEHQQKGKTAFISSHLLSEVQEICDQVAFIREGKLIAVQNMSGLTAGLPKRVTVVSSDKTLQPKLQKLKGMGKIQHTDTKIEATFLGDPTALITLLSQHSLTDVVIQDADLETIFMQYYQEKPHA